LSIIHKILNRGTKVRELKIWKYWVILVASALFPWEGLVRWIMGLIAGFGLAESWEYAGRLFVMSYLMTMSIEPFLGLGICITIIFYLLKDRRDLIPWIFWFGYFGILLGIIYCNFQNNVRIFHVNSNVLALYNTDLSISLVSSITGLIGGFLGLAIWVVQQRLMKQ